MTLTDSVGRIQQIQSTLSMLAAPSARAAQAGTALGSTTTGSTGAAPGTATAGTVKPAPTSSASADLFADALAEAAAPVATVAPAAPVVTDTSPVTSVAPVAPTAVPAPASTDAARLIEAARAYEGVPYVWGGTDPASGLDCSGFVQRAYADIGIQIPRVTWDQMNAGTQVPSLAQAQPGDLLFSHDGGHVSMYLGGGKAIDAPQPGQTVAVRDMWETDANITTIRRILPAAPEGSAAVAPGSDGAASVAPASVSASDPASAAASSAVDSAFAAQAAFLASMAR